MNQDDTVQITWRLGAGGRIRWEGWILIDSRQDVSQVGVGESERFVRRNGEDLSGGGLPGGGSTDTHART